MIRCLHLVSFLLITLIRVQAEVVDTQAWEKRSPENTDDLLAIQKRLKELLPGAKKGLLESRLWMEPVAVLLCLLMG